MLTHRGFLLLTLGRMPIELEMGIDCLFRRMVPEPLPVALPETLPGVVTSPPLTPEEVHQDEQKRDNRQNRNHLLFSLFMAHLPPFPTPWVRILHRPQG